MLLTTVAILGVAALLYVGRYVLLIINRDVLLDSVVAWLGTWVPIGVSIAAIAAVVGCAVLLTEWLIARRATAFRRFEDGDPRRVWAMRAGCLIPIVNLVWPLTYIVELAKVEGTYDRLRRLIWTWETVFVVSTVVSVYAFVMRFFARDTQAVADNTIGFVVANVLAMAAVVITMRLVNGFDAVPVERATRRWLVVADDKESRPESRPAVEPEGQEPAA
jgi:hypothetical protein